MNIGISGATSFDPRATVDVGGDFDLASPTLDEDDAPAAALRFEIEDTWPPEAVQTVPCPPPDHDEE